LRFFNTPILLFFAATIIFSCASDTNNKYDSSRHWELVYINAADGKSLFGSKGELIDFVRKGSPLRIGFGGHRQNDTLISIEHFAEGQFVTITNNNEVFAQISSIIGQAPELDSVPVSMTFKASGKWSMIACTNGSMSTLGMDFILDTLQKPNNQNRGFSWYVQKSILPVDYEHNRIKPLWKNPSKSEAKSNIEK